MEIKKVHGVSFDKSSYERAREWYQKGAQRAQQQ